MSNQAHKTTVSELKQKVAGEQVLFAEGVVTDVFPYYSGVTSKAPIKPWSLQEMTIADANNPNETYTVKFNNFPEVLKTSKGKIVHFLCSQSQQHGFTGVKIKSVEDPKNKPNTRLVLWITESGNVVGLNFKDAAPQSSPAASAQGQPQSQPQQRQQQAPAPQNPAPQNPTPQRSAPAPQVSAPAPAPAAKAESANPAKDVKDAKKFLQRAAHFWVLSMRAADYADELYRVASGGNSMTIEQKQSCTASLFILGTRDAQKFGVHSNMPNDGFEQFIQPKE